MEPEVEYKLTATVNGEQVYLYTSPLAEPVALALSNAQDAVEKELDSLLTLFHESIPDCLHESVGEDENGVWCEDCGEDLTDKLAPDYDAKAKDNEIRNEEV